eukprot:CAMPEP_0194146300 /NCGR_PEP_ID=MMETSP0152-20130528/20505_1 /TAXON_ID=1049557 /ORGANISM="Thalassiothrix antarctica, Strain L6-D1" /LENGTH=173 /DNA_ID=CAMNT_0038846785 /DNA_START=859 /DNA_END=1383 /DNA_ORIENTATION=+
MAKASGKEGDIDDDIVDTLIDDDDDESSSPALHLICQPGNGGPVEDWINVEKIHTLRTSSSTLSLIVNGALDKVRDGYYPKVFFPELGQTIDRFYKPKIEALLYLRPLSDKGCYGWLFRVYPEPWQIVLQTVMEDSKKNEKFIQDTVVYTSQERPTLALAVQKLIAAGQQQQQ